MNVKKEEQGTALQEQHCGIQNTQNHFEILQSLNSIYFTSFYVDLEHDTYSSIYFSPYFQNIIDKEGCYTRFLSAFIEQTIFPDDRDTVKHALSILHIEKELSREKMTDIKRSFFVEYRFASPVHRSYWCRITVVAVDHRPDGRPGHALILLQDINEQRQIMEVSKEAFELLRNSYYRISAIDLNTNHIHNFKIVESEWEEEQRIDGAYDRIIDSCASKHVHPDDREKFVKMLTAQNLKAVLAERKDVVSFTYQRMVDGEYKWVQTEILPLDSYSDEDARVIWYVKNITEEKAKEAEHMQVMMQANAALRDAYEAANRANSAKTDFLSRMSHDIRTPMNAIIGMTAIAGTHLDDKERMADALNKITVASRHLLGLINEVLDMSRIESGKVSLSVEEFNLSDLIDNLLNMVKTPIQEKGHHLVVHVMDIEHENVIGDSLRIQQAFVNIVGNAVKYTPDGGNICITISEKPTKKEREGCFEFVFEDDGIGMSKEFLEKIFDPFERAEDTRISTIQGTGLGMAITKNIVGMMNGDIKVESEVGKGSKFTVTIFLELQNEEIMQVGEWMVLPVLVVDDDKISCESACDILEEIGMKGDWVLSGREAVCKVVEKHRQNEDYFAVILDWKMPEMDGIQTAKEIRRQVGDDIPIIIFSAYDWADIEMEARAAGVNAFISKPLFKSRMLNVFKKLTSKEQENASEHVLDSISRKAYEGKRVLLVEDNELNREIAIEILQMAGLLVEAAENGKVAVDMVNTSQPGYYDLIFMDVQMPVMNGYQATSAIRSLGRGDSWSVPIIAMTANAFAEDVVAAKNAGMNEHIAKPLDIDKLEKVLEKWLSPNAVEK